MARLERLGLVGPLPPPSGGMSNQTRQLARLLGEEGVDVEVVRVNAPYRPGWVAHLRGIRAVFRLLPYLWQLWRMAGRVQLVHIMANSGWSWHLFAAPAVWVAWMRGAPVVLNYRGGEAETFFNKSFRSVGPTLAKTAAVVVPSRFLEAVFQKFGVTTHVVPNVIDLNRFPARPVASDRHMIEAPHLIVTRNLEPIYDNATAIRAFARVRRQKAGACLTIAGSGPDLAELKALAKELGMAEAVSFTGRLDNERMAELYNQADVMINPSLADNMPISVLEALASAVPVVSTDVGGVPFLVADGESALLVPPENDEAMADAVLRLLDDVALRQSLAMEGLEIVKRYAWPKVRERLLPIYQEMLPRAGLSQGDGIANG
jgi:glycosyltransferase involved in cell wall biosynthesis